MEFINAIPALGAILFFTLIFFTCRVEKYSETSRRNFRKNQTFQEKIQSYDMISHF